MKLKHRSLATAGLLTAAALTLSATEWRAVAADHFDSPPRTDPLVAARPDLAADIADIYVWHTTDNVVFAFTFAGPQPLDRPPTYDRDVLYTLNISNAGFPTDPEVQVRFRFGRDAAGNIGIEVTGLPDGGGPLVGPVEQTLSRNNILVRAGIYDDPFFFDLQGFRETRTTGNLQFQSNRNFFNTQNDTAVVFQIPKSRLQNGNNRLDVWVTTARFGGLL